MEIKERRARLEEIKPELRQLGEKAQNSEEEWTEEDQAKWESLTKEHREHSTAVEAADAQAKRSQELARKIEAGQAGKGFGPNSVESRTLEGGNEVRIYQRGQSVLEDMCKRENRSQPNWDFADLLAAHQRAPQNEREKRALQSGSGSGQYVWDSILAARVIDKIREQSRVLQLGAETITIEQPTDYTRIVSDIPISWLAELATMTAQDPTLDQVNVKGLTLRGLTTASRELAADSANLNQVIQTSFVNGMAEELDRAALEGAGTTEPTGIKIATGVGEIDKGSAALAWADLLAGLQTLELAGAEYTGTIVHPRENNALRGATGTDNHWLGAPPGLDQMPILSSKKIDATGGVGTNESTAYQGEWSGMAVVFRLAPTVELLRERFAENFELGFLGFMRADVVLWQPGRFVRIIAITP